MEDFNEYAGRTNGEDTGSGASGQSGLFGLVSEIAKKFDGKDQNELLKAVYDEARRGKANGTLTNEEIDRFAAVLSPVLDDKKRRILEKIVKDLKNIR